MIVQTLSSRVTPDTNFCTLIFSPYLISTIVIMSDTLASAAIQKIFQSALTCPSLISLQALLSDLFFSALPGIVVATSHSLGMPSIVLVVPVILDSILYYYQQIPSIYVSHPGGTFFVINRCRPQTIDSVTVQRHSKDVPFKTLVRKRNPNWSMCQRSLQSNAFYSLTFHSIHE